MDTKSAFIGIDFGTTKSCMAWFNPASGADGGAEILRNAEGEEKMPSVVYFGEWETLVGTPAENELDNIKSVAGEASDDEVMRFIKSIKRNLINPPIIALPGGKDVRPVEVVAEVLRKLKRDAEERHFQEEVKRAVITYPAVFDTKQQAIIRAGATLAGFNAREIVLLEEPVAAALAFGNAGQKVGNGILVYDLGGGTFDLALVVREPDGSFRLAIETDGDANCGGDDFDQALYDYWDDQVKREQGLSFNLKDGALDPRFLKLCRKRKENLSVAQKSQFRSFLPNGKSVAINMERSTFETLIGEQIEKTIRKVRRTLERAKKAGCDVDTVLLIGGSTEIPLVQRRLTEAISLTPQKWQGRDLAVALGAAHYGNQIWADKKPKKPLAMPKRDLFKASRKKSRTAQAAPSLTPVDKVAKRSSDAASNKAAKGRGDVIRPPRDTVVPAPASPGTPPSNLADRPAIVAKPGLSASTPALVVQPPGAAAGPIPADATPTPKKGQGGCVGPLFVLGIIVLMYLISHAKC